jgi:hypothetical protein
MNKIINNKLPPETVRIAYIKDGITADLFEVDYINFLDVRIQIRDNKFENYYVKFENKYIPIGTNGDIKNWPKRMFELQDILLEKLLDWS